jgi:membrane-bound lytic murein transglycosylase D
VPKTEVAPEKDKDNAPEIVDNAKIAVEPDVPDTKKIWVKVGRKDTLASIASRNKVTVAQIKEWNHLKHDKVAAGTSLQLTVPYKAPAPHAATRTAARKAAPAHHRVAAKPAPRNTKVAAKPVKKKRG